MMLHEVTREVAKIIGQVLIVEMINFNGDGWHNQSVKVASYAKYHFCFIDDDGNVLELGDVVRFFIFKIPHGPYVPPEKEAEAPKWITHDGSDKPKCSKVAVVEFVYTEHKAGGGAFNGSGVLDACDVIWPRVDSYRVLWDQENHGVDQINAKLDRPLETTRNALKEPK